MRCRSRGTHSQWFLSGAYTQPGAEGTNLKDARPSRRGALRAHRTGVDADASGSPIACTCRQDSCGPYGLARSTLVLVAYESERQVPEAKPFGDNEETGTVVGLFGAFGSGTLPRTRLQR